MITCLYDLSIEGTTVSGVQVVYTEATASGIYNHNIIQTIGPPYVDSQKIWDKLCELGYTTPNLDYEV